MERRDPKRSRTSVCATSASSRDRGVCPCPLRTRPSNSSSRFFGEICLICSGPGPGSIYLGFSTIPSPYFPASCKSFSRGETWPGWLLITMWPTWWPSYVGSPRNWGPGRCPLSPIPYPCRAEYYLKRQAIVSCRDPAISVLSFLSLCIFQYVIPPDKYRARPCAVKFEISVAVRAYCVPNGAASALPLIGRTICVEAKETCDFSVFTLSSPKASREPEFF